MMAFVIYFTAIPSIFTTFGFFLYGVDSLLHLPLNLSFCLPMNVVSSQVNGFLAVGGRAYYISSSASQVLLQVFVMLSSGQGFDGVECMLLQTALSIQ